MTQFIVPKFSNPGRHHNLKLHKTIDFNGFLPFVKLAFPKLKINCWNRKINQTNERIKMKLTTYQRPGLAWPTFGRLASLQDELDRLFESPLQAWAPALDVHEDKNGYTIRVGTARHETRGH
jgi:hypothetical protein